MERTAKSGDGKLWNAVAAGLSTGSRWLASALQEYLLVTVYVAFVTLIRVMILVLSIPLFLMVVLVSVVDGLRRRDLRRYGAAYESSFVYHHAKRFVKPAFYVPCMVYLSWPSAVYPNLLLLPAACCADTGNGASDINCFIQKVFVSWTTACKARLCALSSAGKPREWRGRFIFNS